MNFIVFGVMVDIGLEVYLILYSYIIDLLINFINIFGVRVDIGLKFYSEKFLSWGVTLKSRS